MKLNEILEKNNIIYEKEKDVPKKRELLITQLEIKPIVFKNMNGFVRFRFSKDPLERTRINKEWYKISKKICRESADTLKFSTDEEFVDYVMKNPKNIEAIDLDDYA